MKCVVTYKSPDHTAHEIRLRNSMTIGRSPGRGGLSLTPHDNSISARAVVLDLGVGGLTVRNTSSFAQIDVHHDQGVRFLFPGEALTTFSSIRLLIPGAIYTHQISVDLTGLSHNKTDSGTTARLTEDDFVVAEERLPALVGLCAARFFPERLGSSLLTATEIANLLSRRGHNVTPKAVNNKLQRLRNDIAERLGVYLDSREDLADWAIRNGHVKRSQVLELIDT